MIFVAYQRSVMILACVIVGLAFGGCSRSESPPSQQNEAAPVSTVASAPDVGAATERGVPDSAAAPPATPQRVLPTPRADRIEFGSLIGSPQCTEDDTMRIETSRGTILAGIRVEGAMTCQAITENVPVFRQEPETIALSYVPVVGDQPAGLEFASPAGSTFLVVTGYRSL